MGVRAAAVVDDILQLFLYIGGAFCKKYKGFVIVKLDPWVALELCVCAVNPFQTLFSIHPSQSPVPFVA